MRARWGRVAAVLMGVAIVAGCASHPESLAPANLDIVCTGDGSPTVLLIPGRDADLTAYDELAADVATDTRVCAYSRAGIGNSPPWPKDLADPSAGMAADQLRATLEEREIAGPFVVLGWSYGGLVAEAFAVRHRDLTAGLVFEDASTAEIFKIFPEDLREGGRAIDLITSAEEVEGLDLSGLPVIVLTQGPRAADFPPDDLRVWTETHDHLAALSDDSIHLIAVDAGHGIHFDSEALVEKAIDAVVEAVRSGAPLAECDDFEWVPYGGECR